MDKVIAYFSHSIRGKKGAAATKEDMDANCMGAKRVASWLCEMVPDLELYVPAEHEDFVQIAYLEKILTEKQILDVDCKILEKRDLLIVLEIDGWRGGGIGVEIAHAKLHEIPIFFLTDTDATSLMFLKRMIKEILEMKESRDD